LLTFRTTEAAKTDQAEHFLNDLVRDLSLPKSSSEVIRSKLHQNNLLTPGTAFPFTEE